MFSLSVNRHLGNPSSLRLALCICILGFPFLGTPLANAEGNSVEIRDGVLFEKNVPIAMRDGSVLMGNVFRPKAEGRYPVLLSMSVYGKDLHTRDYMPDVWTEMLTHIPELCLASSCEYHSWEVPDPEVWVPDGYVIVRIDARGAGKSPGRIDPFSPAETRDLYDSIEWAGQESWSSGKVGLAGISYYAIVQWNVAAQQPPHLAAIAPWEGAHDSYRDISRHGGIQSNVFAELWMDRQVAPVQHGNADSDFRDMDSGKPIGGPDALTDRELQANRAKMVEAIAKRPLISPWYQERTANLADIKVPLLSAANWGGYGLHARGNFNGFLGAGSKQKWLRVHTGDHIAPFYSPEGTATLKQFYDRFLKGVDNGWDDRSPISLDIRHADGSNQIREEAEWPLKRTSWTRLYLSRVDTGESNSLSLAQSAPQVAEKVSFDALEGPVVFQTPPLPVGIELTGPLAAKLFVSSSTEDMDIFATVQAFAPDGTEVTLPGASEPATPIAQGWLRASHRKLDPNRSSPWQPVHTHDEIQLLTPGDVYEVDVEIWPAQIVLPAGYTLALRLEGKDFSRPRSGITGWFKDLLFDDILGVNVRTGSGLFLHNHPEDRPKDVFGGKSTIHFGDKYRSFLMVPIIPGAGVD